jgi:HK97 gp10 family phage protein
MPTEIKLTNNIMKLPKLFQDALAESMEKGGAVMANAMRRTIDAGVPPPNAPSTIAQKGSSKTLFDTGLMYGEIQSEVRDNGKSVVVGVIGSRANVAAYNEFGTSRIPERSFIRSTISQDTNIGQFTNEIKNKLNEAIDSAKVK